MVFIRDPNGLGQRWAIERYDADTVGVLWTYLVDPGQDEFYGRVTVAPNGDVYATGGTDPDSDDGNVNSNMIAVASTAPAERRSGCSSSARRRSITASKASIWSCAGIACWSWERPPST